MKDKKPEKSIIQKATLDEIQYCNLDVKDRTTVEKALQEGYSRRSVLKLMMATGVTMATAGHLFTAGGEAMAATPKKGGKLVFASDLHGPSDTLDPGLNTSTIDYTRGRSTYNSLCQINDDLSTRPELAE